MRYEVVTFKFMLENHFELLEENFKETGEGGEFSPYMEFYEMIEHDKTSFCLVAYDGDVAVAYGAVVSSRSMHSKRVEATNDALYVKPSYRGATVAGKLMLMLEREAKRRGCTTFLWEAPEMSRLAKTLAKRKAYKLIEAVYEKEL